MRITFMSGHTTNNSSRQLSKSTKNFTSNHLGANKPVQNNPKIGKLCQKYIEYFVAGMEAMFSIFKPKV